MSINHCVRLLTSFPEYPKNDLLKVTNVTEEQFNSCLKNGYITVDSVTQCVSITDIGRNVMSRGGAFVILNRGDL